MVLTTLPVVTIVDFYGIQPHPLLASRSSVVGQLILGNDRRRDGRPDGPIAYAICYEAVSS